MQGIYTNKVKKRSSILPQVLQAWCQSAHWFSSWLQIHEYLSNIDSTQEKKDISSRYYFWWGWSMRWKTNSLYGNQYQKTWWGNLSHRKTSIRQIRRHSAWKKYKNWIINNPSSQLWSRKPGRCQHWYRNWNYKQASRGQRSKMGTESISNTWFFCLKCISS